MVRSLCGPVAARAAKVSEAWKCGYIGAMRRRRAWFALASSALIAAGIVLVTPPSASAEELTLTQAIESLSVASENRSGYQRTSFKHWIDEDKDGCSTRN